MNATITSVTGYEILASGGFPSLEVKVTLQSGQVGRASVPYGASAGSHEASVLLDGDPERYQGKGMLKAVANVIQLGRELIGKDATDQRAIDQYLIQQDGTPQKTTFGGNAILAISLAVARAAAAHNRQPLYRYIIDHYQLETDLSHLPHPMVVAIEGGKHADNTTDLQEYCLTAMNPQDTATEAVRKVLETYHHLKSVLQSHQLSTNVGNEGAFAPDGISSNEAPLQYMQEALAKTKYQAGVDIGFSLDAAASEYYSDGKYHLTVDGQSLNGEALLDYYEAWFKKYPLVTVEDLFHEDDWKHWTAAKKVCDRYKLLLVGDDLTVTNPIRLQKAIEHEAISSILIKLNQIGSLTETIDVCMMAKEHGMSTITSHRGGGETNDTAMVDVAVAVGSSHIKVGPTRGERVSKYNRLMEIEREVS